MAETTVPVDDTGMLSSIMAEGSEPEQIIQETTPEPETETEKQDRERDEKGRFVAKAEPAEEPAPEPEPKPEQKDDAHVPSWRLREVREAREAAERRAEEEARQRYALQAELQQMRSQLTQLQKPKPEPVDFFQNPDEAFQQRLSPLEERIQTAERNLLMRASRAEAVAEYGKATVTEMETAIEKAMQSNHPGMTALAAQMRTSDHPVGVAMNWYRQNTLYERTGGDLDAYVQKQLDERLKDPTFLAKAVEAARAQAGQPPSPQVKLPPSLNRVAGSGVTQSELDNSDMTDAALFKHAAAPMKRAAR